MGVHGAWAQDAISQQQMLMGQNQSIAAAIVTPITGEPYQAEKVTKSVQTLSDGTVIAHETRGTIARDAAGRMREDIYMIHSGNVNGQQREMDLQSATVGDPLAHSMLIWTGTTTKVAMRMQLPALPNTPSMVTRPDGIKAIYMDAPPPPVVRRPSAASVTPSTAAPSNNMPNMGPPTSPLVGGGKLASPLGGVPGSKVQTEELGKQSMEGVLVTGKRVTTTIPINAVGNDRPFNVVHEEWRSVELKIVVKTIDSDPRTGTQTMELQTLSRADPDPSLFQAPAGYEVKDMADMLKGLGSIRHTAQQ